MAAAPATASIACMRASSNAGSIIPDFWRAAEPEPRQPMAPGGCCADVGRGDAGIPPPPFEPMKAFAFGCAARGDGGGGTRVGTRVGTRAERGDDGEDDEGEDVVDHGGDAYEGSEGCVELAHAAHHGGGHSYACR